MKKNFVENIERIKMRILAETYELHKRTNRNARN